MAAKTEDAPALPAATPLDASDPGLEPAGPVPRKREKVEEEEVAVVAVEGEALPRESKRRRTCPAALEMLPSSSAAREEAEDEGSSGSALRELSFSFDTRGFVSSVETTPKFGCFRFPVADLGIPVAEAEAQVGVEEDGVAGEEKHGVVRIIE